jgi:hypothetical protein
MPRLKVFKAHLGFYDSVVAVPSRKAALAAWGTRQDLFREGIASEAGDSEAARVALAAPGVVLTRPAGSAEPYRAKAVVPKGPATVSQHAATPKPARTPRRG